MFVLTEQVIRAAIDAISGYIVTITAEETKKPLEEVTEYFLTSKTYELLSDAETGYYWDSIDELIDLFKNEFQSYFYSTISQETGVTVPPLRNKLP